MSPRGQRTRLKSKDVYETRSARFHTETDSDVLAAIDRAMAQGATFKQVFLAAYAESSGLDVGDLVNSRFSPRDIRELAGAIARMQNLDFRGMAQQLDELIELVGQLGNAVQDLSEAVRSLESAGVSQKPARRPKKGRGDEARSNMLAMLGSASVIDD